MEPRPPSEARLTPRRSRRQCGVCALVLIAAGGLSGCALARAPIEVLELPRPEIPEDAEWPRLVDGPAPQAEGEAPDPEEGRRIAETLGADAAAGAAEAERLGAAPVVDPAESARLRRAAEN